MNKILKVALTAIPTTIAVSAPITALSSCKTVVPGLKDIKVWFSNSGIHNYLHFRMHFSKNIKDAGQGALINLNYVILKVSVGHEPINPISGSIKATAIDDSIYMFDWQCSAKWEEQSTDYYRLVEISYFHVIEIHS